MRPKVDILLTAMNCNPFRCRRRRASRQGRDHTPRSGTRPPSNSLSSGQPNVPLATGANTLRKSRPSEIHTVPPDSQPARNERDATATKVGEASSNDHSRKQNQRLSTHEELRQEPSSRPQSAIRPTGRQPKHSPHARFDANPVEHQDAATPIDMPHHMNTHPPKVEHRPARKLSSGSDHSERKHSGSVKSKTSSESHRSSESKASGDESSHKRKSPRKSQSFDAASPGGPGEDRKDGSSGGSAAGQSSSGAANEEHSKPKVNSSGEEHSKGRGSSSRDKRKSKGGETPSDIGSGSNERSHEHSQNGDGQQQGDRDRLTNGGTPGDQGQGHRWNKRLTTYPEVVSLRGQTHPALKDTTRPYLTMSPEVNGVAVSIRITGDGIPVVFEVSRTLKKSLA